MSTCSRTISPLRQRMIDDMTARKLAPQTQHLHIASCKRFAAFLQRSPETATVDDICRFQLQLAESGMEIAYRNRIVTGVKFLFRVTLRRHDLAAEMYHLTEPRKIPVVMSQAEVKDLLAAAKTLKLRTMLSLTYGCGLRISEIVKLRVGDIDSSQNIIRIVQAKGRKDRHVMLPPEVLKLLRQWWGERPTKTMTLSPHEFIRRFLMHVLPKGFHRIRHYGLFASDSHAANVARARELLCASAPPDRAGQAEATNTTKMEAPDRCCPSCGGRMIVIERFARGCEPQCRPNPERIDSS